MINLPGLEAIAAFLLLAGLIAYTLFGGADFGSGFWTALAFGPRARQIRASLFNAIGPIWETNHVWLIFVVVTLFTAFPAGFRALFIALLIPLVIALIGINFRGAAFAFRHFGKAGPAQLPATGLVFSVSSILTPFIMGMAVTAAASGRITLADGLVQSDLWTGWISLFTLVGGLIGLALCAYLTPIYMTVRVKGELQEDFRKMGIAAALALGVLTAVEIPAAIIDAPLFAGRMLRIGPVICVILAVTAGLTTLALLGLRRYLLAQLSAGATVVTTLAGFGLALYPDLIIGQLSFAQAAAPSATLRAILTVLPFGALILIPSLIWLYWTFRGAPEGDGVSTG